MSKVFLSYSHKDETFVRELYRRLKRDGVECFFDKESIGWGDNWVLELGKGLDECTFIVLILTPGFCRSEWVKLERTSVMADDPAGMKKKIRPLLLKECNDDMPRFLKPIQYIDVTTDETFEKNYPSICSQLGGVYSKEEEETVKRTQLPPLCRLPSKHRMPYRSLGDRFAGRVADLWKIDDGLGRCGTAVVQGVGMVIGMGGIGKTQLAVEYVHRFGRHFPGGVFWVDAERGRMTMTAQVAEAAGIELDPGMDEQAQLDMLWHRLGGSRVLMILDNFPGGEDIETWLPPQKSIYTLVTSRRKDFYNYFSHDLGKLDHKEALALLNSGARGFEAEEAVTLIDALEGLPLALELVKHFLNLRPELSIKGLLEEMSALGQIEALEIFTEKYANQLPTGHSKQVAATFRMGWDLASPFERKVLQAMSLLAPAPVPRRILTAIMKKNTKGFRQVVRRFFKIFGLYSESKLRDPLDEAVSRLNAGLSLVELDGETAPRMHRLISAFVRTLTDEGDPIQKNVITAVRDEMVRVTDDKDTQSFRQLEKVIPHADFLLTSGDMEPGQAVYIANYMGWHHWKWGRYRLGEGYKRKALRLAEANYKPGAPEIATQQSNLALLLMELGELEEARDLLRAALEANQKTFEPGHPSIATRQSNLAMVLQDLGELEDARDLLRAALEATEKTFAPGHPYIAGSQSNLALVLKDSGELEEARDLLRAALKADQKSFAPGHPSIAKRQSNLALLLADLGELKEAKELLTRAYQALLKNQGPDFPGTKIVKKNLDEVSKRLK